MHSAAAAAPRSSLEAMLETIRKRDVQAEDAVPFLPPLPARPRCRVRPPTPKRRSQPPGFKLGNGGGVGSGTVPVDDKAGVDTGGATISAGGAAGHSVTSVNLSFSSLALSNFSRKPVYSLFLVSYTLKNRDTDQHALVHACASSQKTRARTKHQAKLKLATARRGG